MGLETTFDFIEHLNPAFPESTDELSQADDHFRGIKNATKGSFPNLGLEAVTATAAELNLTTTLEADLLAIDEALLLKADITYVDDSIADVNTRMDTFEVAGSVKMWPAVAAPAGWLECDGATIDAAVDPQLQALIDILNPGGNTTAVLPDTRGEFVRGWDNTRGVDAARAILSAQGEDVGAHTHPATFAGTALPNHTHQLFSGNNNDINNQPYLNPTAPSNDYNRTTGGTSAGTPAGSVTVSNSTGVETRPRNIALMYIIKAFNVTP